MPATPTPARLEAFSDGVIAVIITIMVLELKVPKQHGLSGFLTVLPTLGINALSFAFTAIYWVNHHHLIDRLRRVTPSILWANLIFLFCLSVLPFFTGYMVEQQLDSFSVVLYIATLLSAGTSFTLLQVVVGRYLHRQGQFESEEEAGLQRREQRKALLSVAIYLTAVPVAFFFRPSSAILLAGAVTLIWILPTFGIRRTNVRHNELS